MTLGLFVPRSFVSPDGSCGYIPRRRLYFSMAGSGLSRVHRTAVYGGQPLTVCPGYAFSPASGGGISSRAAPFPKNGKGRGVWVDPLHYRIGNVKKCAVGKHPKSEKHGNTAQFSEVERSGTQENCGGIESGCLLRLHPLPVPRRRQPKRVACIDPDAVVVDKNIAKNDRFDLFSR